jgi:hypothetical protein
MRARSNGSDPLPDNFGSGTVKDARDPLLRNHSRALLVNFVYFNPVGHVIEALHYCHGYYRANPETYLAVAINVKGPTELADWCDYISRTYSIPFDPFDPVANENSVDAIPTGWAWILNDQRGHQPTQRSLFPGLAAYYDRSNRKFSVTGSVIGIAGSEPPAYAPGESFRLTIPFDLREKLERWIAVTLPESVAPLIAILPAGNGERHTYPSVRSWRLVLSALRTEWPNSGFMYFGKHLQDGRTTTSFYKFELDDLVNEFPPALDARDLPLQEQLALVSFCDFLLSPHSGFGMAALAVGTPWLTIAGNRWPEYYFNGVPFYSVIPDTKLFPAYHSFGPEPRPIDDDGPRAPSMCYERIRSDLDELLLGATRLVTHQWPFDTAMTHYFDRLLVSLGGRRELIESIDNVHHQYMRSTDGES